MNREWSRVYRAVLFVFTACVVTACGADEPAEVPTGGIEGTVALEGLETAERVEISLGDRATSETEQEGTFSFQNIETGTYELTFEREQYVTATKELEVEDGKTVNVEVTLQQVNEPPRLQGVTVNRSRLEPGETANVEVTATDPNPDDLTYEFTVSGDFSVASAEGHEATIEAPDAFDARGTLSVLVKDADEAADSDHLQVTTIDNSPPTINGISASPQTLKPGATTSVSAHASDPDGGELTFEWSTPNGWSIDDASQANIEVTAPDSYEATGVLELTVIDDRGVSTSGSISLATVANDGPVISSVTAAPQTANRKGEIALDVSAIDPNGDQLGYEWSAPMGWSFDDKSIAQPTLTAPDTPGSSATIEVTVTDSEGLSATGSVVVSTRVNQAPLVSSVVAESTSLSRQGATEVTVSASDPNGNPLTYSWSLDNPNWSYTGSGETITLQAPDASSSSTKVEVTVTDDVEGSATASIVVTTVPNKAPIISSVYAKKNPIARAGTTEVVVDARDPNNDNLSYSWTIDNGNWTKSGNGSTITLEAPDTPSSSVLVTVTVEDDVNGASKASAQVNTVSNSAPQITTVPQQTNPVAGRSNIIYQAKASDPDDRNLDWSLTTQPSTSASVDNSGKVTWEIGRSATGTTFTFSLLVDDGTDTVTQTFDVDVDPFDMTPVGTFSTDAFSMSGAAGDLDGDGKTDLAAAETDNLTSLLSSRGFQNLQTTYGNYPSNHGDCEYSATADLDGDGDLDVVNGCNENGSGDQNLTLATWINDIDQSDHSGSMSAGSAFNSGQRADVADLVAAKIGGDAGADFVVADTQDFIHVVTNDGKGALTFSQTISPSAPSAAGSPSYYRIERIVVDDFDNDPELEVLALEGYHDGSSYQAQLAVYDFDSSGTLQSTRSTTTSLTDDPDKMAAGDLDGDGDLDVAVKTSGSPVTVETYLNDGSASFSADDSIDDGPALTNSSSNRGIAIGQIDNDGHADVVVGTDATGTAHIAFGDGTGDLSDIVQLGPTQLGSDEFEEVFLGDYNGDGFTDIIGWDFDRLVVYR